jgi:hypothetical protein
MDDEVVKDLNDLREFVVTSKTSEPTFARIGVPMGFSIMQTNLASPSADISNDFLRIWESEYCNYSFPASSSKKRKEIELKKSFAFPFSRTPFAMSQMDLKFSKSVIVPVSGFLSR